MLDPIGLIAAGSGFDRPTFTWASSPGAGHYYLAVLDKNTGAKPIVVPNLSGTSYAPTTAQALTPGHSFTIYVYAFSTNGLTYKLATQTFTLAALAAPTVLGPIGLIPAGSGFDTPTFSWNASPGVGHYYLKVKDDNTDTTPIVVPSLNGTSYVPPAAQALTPGHTFTIYVYAFSTNGEAYSLATQTFTLAALAAPTGLTPSGLIAAGSGFDTPTFSWNASPGIGRYYLAVKDDNTGATPVVVPDLTGTSYVPTTAQALTPGHRFTLYVYAVSTNSKTYSLATQTFTLAALACANADIPDRPDCDAPSNLRLVARGRRRPLLSLCRGRHRRHGDYQ